MLDLYCIDNTIGNWIKGLKITNANKVALITSLDSNVTPSNLIGISPELKQIKNVKPFGDYLLVPTQSLKKFNIFYGYDEVWFFGNEVSKPINFNSPLEELTEWMLDNKCSMAVNDSDEMKVIAMY